MGYPIFFVPYLGDLIVFPECALTGFSPHINFNEAVVHPFLHSLAELAESSSTTIFLPSAIPSGDKFYNSGFLIHSDGQQFQFFKEGLTESEERFFVSHRNQFRIFDVKGYSIGYLLCMEASEEPWKYLSATEHLDVILWPGYWGWKHSVSWDESLDKLSKNVYLNMLTWKKPLIQINFCDNCKTDKRKSSPEGLSVVIDKDNQMIFCAPHKEECVFLVKYDEGVEVERYFA